MQKMLAVLMLGLALGLSSFAAPAMAQSQGSDQLIVRDSTDRLWVAGGGAILGTLFFNMATAYFGGLPFAAAPIAPVATDFMLGSRILAGVTAGGGALAAHYLYAYFKS